MVHVDGLSVVLLAFGEVKCRLLQTESVATPAEFFFFALIDFFDDFVPRSLSLLSHSLGRVSPPMEEYVILLLTCSSRTGLIQPPANQAPAATNAAAGQCFCSVSPDSCVVSPAPP